jgi:hypothetical protein
MSDGPLDPDGVQGDATAPLRPWRSLGEAEQTALRVAYQEALDREPPTCSLDTKIERFARWLAARGVAFSRSDL